MAQTSFLLSDTLLSIIDAEARRRGLSRADVIREKLNVAFNLDHPDQVSQFPHPSEQPMPVQAQQS